MKRTAYLISIFILFQTIIVFGQTNIDFTNYVNVQSKSPLPDEVELSWKVTADNNYNSENNNKQLNKKDKDFYISSSYSLNKLLISGSILYNTEMDIYVNKVLEYILSANNIPADLHEMRVFVVRSSEVNAFAINENIIFVTIGLLAKIETEAELAFVLCHEFIHYQNEHSFTSYKKDKEIDNNYKTYRKNNELDVLLKKAYYSQKLEKEADQQGLELFLHTDYDLQAPLNLLDMLHYYYLPFDDITFNKKDFETDYLKFPDSYLISDVTPLGTRAIEQDEKKKDDDLSTHPGIEDRKTNIQDITHNLSNDSKTFFHVSENDFRNIKKMAQYELMRINLIERKYEEVMYNSYVLMKGGDNSSYINKMFAKAIYGLATYANNTKLREVKIKDKDSEGQLQAMAHFLSSMGKKELSYLALRMTWEIRQKFPDDQQLVHLNDDLFLQCRQFHKMDLTFFKTDTLDKTIDTTKAKKDKYKYLEYGFVDLMKNTDFVSKVDQYSKIKTNQKRETKDEDINSELDKPIIADKKSKNKKLALDQFMRSDENVDKVLFFDPIIIKLDFRKNKKSIYNANDKAKRRIVADLAIASEKANIDIDILNKDSIGVNDASKLNDIALVKDFLTERFDHDDMPIIPTDEIRLANLCKRYGVKHVGFIGIFNYVEPTNALNALLLLTPLFPYGIYKLAAPKKHSIFVVAVYSLDSNTTSYMNAVDVAGYNGNEMLLGQLYYLLSNIKNSQSK